MVYLLMTSKVTLQVSGNFGTVTQLKEYPMHLQVPQLFTIIL